MDNVILCVKANTHMLIFTELVTESGQKQSFLLLNQLILLLVSQVWP